MNIPWLILGLQGNRTGTDQTYISLYSKSIYVSYVYFARYVYVIGWVNSFNPSCTFANSVTKVDLKTNKIANAWRGGPFCHPAEPVQVNSDIHCPL